MEASFEFPSAKANDGSDVATALETAQALWRRGDSREALRWLRRAAEGAETEGDDLRAVALARAAADLQDRLPAVSSAPAPTPSHPPPTSKRPPPLTQASATPAPVRTSAPPPPSQRAVANTGGLEPWSPPASRPAPEPERSSPRVSRPPPLPQSELPSAPSRPPPLPQSELASAPARSKPAPEVKTPTPETPRAPIAEVHALAERSAAPPAESQRARPADGPKARSAVRVSVELLSKKSGTLLVRLLGENDPPPANAHEALLVPLEPDVDLRNL
jgi:hypothetical protein